MNKILVIVSALLMAASAQAGLLQWQVDAQDFRGQDIGYGQLRANGGSTLGGDLFSAPDAGVSLAEVGGDGSFYVEFFNYSGESIAVSDTQTYSDLVAAGYIAEGTSAVAMATWHPTASAAPEPTSAMLMMMGVAFLGLKRRKA